VDSELPPHVGEQVGVRVPAVLLPSALLLLLLLLALLPAVPLLLLPAVPLLLLLLSAVPLLLLLLSAVRRSSGAIVLGPLASVAQQVVGLGKLAEPLGRLWARVDIRVELLGLRAYREEEEDSEQHE